MSRFAAIGMGMLCFAATAHAQQQISAEPVRIVITKVDCSRLIRHTPTVDVAYQPGIDARGRAVTPADMPGSGANAIPGLLPDVLEFPITINPVAYGARNQAQREKATAAQGLADTYSNKTAAQAQITTLTAQKTTLSTQAATLAAQKAALVAEKATLVSTLATLQGEVDAGTRPGYDRTYTQAKAAVPAKQTQITAKQSEIDTNTSSLTTTTAAIVAQQAIVDAAPGKDAQYTANQAASDAKLAKISAKGLDSTAMTVGNVRYDVAKGTFTFNGQPLASPEQEELARACARQGVR